jgi:hypothetical protein
VQGKVKPEKPCIKLSGKKGRMDIHVEVKEENKLVSCVEVKNTDWNRMTEQSIRRNVKRQINQVWNYIDSELTRGKEISPGIIFPKKPRGKSKLNLVERLFEEKGIPVVWNDESIKERTNI